MIVSFNSDSVTPFTISFTESLKSGEAVISDSDTNFPSKAIMLMKSCCPLNADKSIFNIELTGLGKD
ncbi:MAG: hypothetical protein IPN13_23485 [Bacteroidetes bacterium]|nr:hypothetical protein [Bacteroidota bacterium]